MVFRMFLAFFIFDPNLPFWKGYGPFTGYSLCNIANFQNCLISRVFGVVSSGFLHRTTLLILQNGFLMFQAFLIFDPNLPFYKGYSLCKGYSLYMGYRLCKMADFQNCLISRIFGGFSTVFLQRTILKFLQNGFLHVFGIFNF